MAIFPIVSTTPKTMPIMNMSPKQQKVVVGDHNDYGVTPVNLMLVAGHLLQPRRDGSLALNAEHLWKQSIVRPAPCLMPCHRLLCHDTRVLELTAPPDWENRNLFQGSMPSVLTQSLKSSLLSDHSLRLTRSSD